MVGGQRGEAGAAPEGRRAGVRARLRRDSTTVRHVRGPLPTLDRQGKVNADMAIDLTGGIDPAREYMFAERPTDPEMRDSVSFWVFDDRGQVGLPRVGVEAVAANWAEHSIQVNVAFPDGRAYRLRDEANAWPVEGPDGKACVLGAGPLAFT